MFRHMCIVVLTLFLSQAASAAELRISLKELVSLLDPILEKTRLRLHNVPSDNIFGGFFDPNEQSFVQFGDSKVALDLPTRSFPLSGVGSGRYAYYLNDISTESISVRANGSALELAVKFEDKDAELVGGCVSGTCGFVPALPIVNWTNPEIIVRLNPVIYNDGISMMVSNVVVKGYFRARCRRGSILCGLARSWAERYINRLRTGDLPRLMKETLNTEQNRATLAAQLEKFLNIGSTGKISVVGLNVSNKLLRVSFRFP